MDNGTDLGAALSSIILPIVKQAIAEAMGEQRSADDEQLMTRKQVAQWLQISERQVDILKQKGMPFLLAGDCPRFLKSEVTQWMRERSRG